MTRKEDESAADLAESEAELREHLEVFERRQSEMERTQSVLASRVEAQAGQIAELVRQLQEVRARRTGDLVQRLAGR